MPGLLQIAAVIRWWINRMCITPRPLQEKLTMFWHGHFTTSADPVFSAGLLLGQNQTLRAHAAGHFPELLLAAARDPAMLIYLDGFRNKKAHPNENFARELLELFTLGAGNYTEKDVREAARAFTGWTLQLPAFKFRFDPNEHDNGPKRFLGHTGCFTGEDVIGILAAHPQTARHVCARLYRNFADEDAGEKETIRLAEIFQRSRGAIRPVVEAILTAPRFREVLARRPGYRSPLEILVASLHAVDQPLERLDWLKRVHEMGQLPFLPPTVKGWEGGDAWIHTGTLLDRLQFAHDVARLGSPKIRPEASGVQAARNILWSIGMADAAQSTRRALADAWRGDARQLLTLALCSPDFQRR